MSQLTSALERISKWYEVNEPDEHPIFKPGLSREYIEEQWQKLESNFPIPDDRIAEELEKKYMIQNK